VVVVLKKSLLTLIMVTLSIWITRYGILWQLSEKKTVSTSKIDTKYFADDWYSFGIRAWYENNTILAADCFRKVLSINMLHADAWLKLAHAETINGNKMLGTDILEFTHYLTGKMIQWKWSQLLLARELKLDNIFFENLNFIIPDRQFQDEALNLLDMHLKNDSIAVLKFLERRNWQYYLRWLMKWNRTEDTFKVWLAISENEIVDNDLLQKYINFLVTQKEIMRAATIREKFTGINRMTNSGFELPISNNGFDWRIRTGTHWYIQQTKSEVMEGNYSLQMIFSGKENINFHHLSQIVPVLPGKNYNIAFWWRSKDLTTDQRPFIEIRGLDCNDKSYWKSDMVASNTDWTQQKLFVSIPESCFAVTVTLRRHPSQRFDSKISGILWLDHFQMEVLESHSVLNEN
jgi:hypothetical protein